MLHSHYKLMSKRDLYNSILYIKIWYDGIVSEIEQLEKEADWLAEKCAEKDPMACSCKENWRDHARKAVAEKEKECPTS